MHNKNIIVPVYSFLSFPPSLKNIVSIKTNDEFLIDSGCSNTIVTSEDRILNIWKPDPIVVISQVNSELIPVSLVGDLELKKSLPPIENVSVAPECSTNLLSISQMCKLWNAFVIFDKDGVSVTKKSIDLPQAEKILSGPLQNELYNVTLPKVDVQEAYCMKLVEEADSEEYIEPKVDNPKQVRHTLCPPCEKELKLWHGWTGHQSGLRRTIKARAIHSLSDNYHKLIADLNDVCDACVFVKNKKQLHYTGMRTFHH